MALEDLTRVLAPQGNLQYCALCTINGRHLNNLHDPLIDFAVERSFTFDGWVINPENKSFEGGVFGVVDGTYIIPAAYGLDRPDAAEYLNNASLSCCGYWGSCRSDFFPKGKHSLSLAIVKPDKQHYYSLPNICNFETK